MATHVLEAVAILFILSSHCHIFVILSEFISRVALIHLNVVQVKIPLDFQS